MGPSSTFTLNRGRAIICDGDPISIHSGRPLPPLGTTLLSAIFFTVLLNRYLERRSGSYLLWWALGIFAYGLGTALESSITLFGNSIALTKAWYIAGALLGGYPLA